MLAERYHRQSKLGEGQMSVVWLAQDTYASSQEPVVVKLMKAILEDDRRNQKARERFHREIEIARSLQHPHILPVLDYGYVEYEENRVPYLVSPYVREGSLADFIKKRPPWVHWSLLQTADVIMQAAESIWCLHSHTPPIVHEDIKPGNFLCHLVDTPERMVYLYLCDFGISRWKQENAATTASELLGTFQFMAPEQFERKVEFASDQYALAIMACYLLTGKLPIQAATHEMYPTVHMHERPMPPSALNPARMRSTAIDAVVLRALEKRPGKRYPSIIEFARALQAAITQYVQDLASAPTDWDSDAQASLRQRNGPLAGNLLSATPFQADISLALDPPETSGEHVLDEPLPARVLKNALAALKDEAVPFTPLHYNEAARFSLPARPRLFCWDRAGSGLACVLYEHAPLIVRRDGTQQEIRMPNAFQATRFCWSPDGRTLAIVTQGEIHFWDCSAQSPLPLVLRFNTRTIDGLDWSVAEQLAVWVENSIFIYQLTFVQLTQVFVAAPRQIAANGLRSGGVDVLRWSPDGLWLAAGAQNGHVLCWSTIPQGATWKVAGAGQKVNSLSWSPDGALLVVAFRDNRVAGWDARTQQRVLLWQNLPAMPRIISVTTGSRIAIASSEHRLLLGMPDDVLPAGIVAGQLLVACSPVHPELATLDEQKDRILAIWHE